MNGSVRKRGKSWYYRMDLAYINGERKQVERYGGKTKEEAQNNLRKAIREYQTAGDILTLSNISVTDYFEYWFEKYVKVNLKVNTQKNYRGILDNHIYPYIGKYQLKSVKAGMLQELLNKEFEKGFSKQTLSIIKGVLNKRFKMAVYPYEYLQQDPTRYINIPKYDQKEWKDKGDLKIISMDDFKVLSSAITPSDPYYLPMMITFQTGLRRAEVCGLMWKDIDFEDETITVERIMIQTDKDFTLGSPKTKASYRTIMMGSSLSQLLKKMKNRQKENKLFYGQKYTDSDFVCVKENGKVVTPNSIKWYTAKLRKQTGINFNFHSFRHTHATMLLEQGAKPKEIQARLGHSRLSTTMDTYAHVTKKMKKDTVDIFEKLLRDSAF